MDMLDLYNEMMDLYSEKATDSQQLDFDMQMPAEEIGWAVPVSKNGMSCDKCGEFYPYVERPNQDDGTFKCWSCRNF